MSVVMISLVLNLNNGTVSQTQYGPFATQQTCVQAARDLLAGTGTEVKVKGGEVDAVLILQANGMDYKYSYRITCVQQ